MARSVDNNKAGASTARLFHYLYKLSASASPCFEWYPPASSFSKGFPGRACVNPEELFLFPGLHYSLNIKHVLCHYSQHVPGGQFGVVTISFWDYLWSSCQTAPFAKTKAWGGKLPQLLIGTSPSAKSLILSSCFTFLPFDFFHVHFCRMVSSLFWFCLDLNSSAFPQYLFLYHTPPSGQKILHEEVFKLPWRRLSLYLFTSQEQWATSLAHLWCWIQPGII